MFRGLFEGPAIIIIAVLVIVLFGAKRLPDAARSIGRSMRVFKTEVDGMKSDSTSGSSASSSTVQGETVSDDVPSSTTPDNRA